MQKGRQKTMAQGAEKKRETGIEYQEFIESKRIFDVDSGFSTDADKINPMLFDFQASVVEWALKRGRAAIFGDTGLGKTPMQLAWAYEVHKHTGKDILLLAPLAVSKQTHREGIKFGIPSTVVRKQADVKPGINIANYEMLHHFDRNAFVGLVIDESSILKSYSGKFRKAITEFAEAIPYRLACTATPAPNDTMEIINHAEFLGIMSGREILALFFVQDFKATSHTWKLKGHAKEEFWKWLASWCRAFRLPQDLGFDNNGFILPPLKIKQHATKIEQFSSGTLFALEAKTLDEQRHSRRTSLRKRVIRCKKIVAKRENQQWLIWCDLNIESKAIKKAIPGAVEITGSDSSEFKEKAMLDFVAGKIKVLVTKPLIAGFGMNFQCCHNIIFMGLGNSFEKYYQAIRRCWRFGQSHKVTAHVVISESDGAVVANISRKEKLANEMFDELVSNMKDFQTKKTKREEAEYMEDVKSGIGWELRLGDSIDTTKSIKTDSVGLIVYSPPFPGMYVYSNTPRDIGNVRDMKEMIKHYKFLLPELYRILMPGRNCCVHLTQGVSFKHTDGHAGLKDFRGAVIKAHEKAGFIYYGEVCIEKNPQLKAIRTKDHGLLFKTLSIDSAACRMALADYVLQFKKPGDNPIPIRAGKGNSAKTKNEKGWLTNEEWIKWASPVWYMNSEDAPDGIRESDVLNVSRARDEKDEKHLCPLQLSVIERCIKLWSNPGEIVYDPFTGIGSTGYEAIKHGRQFAGGELKQSYFNVAISNLKEAEKLLDQGDLLTWRNDT
jgi:superfamily II DNA or RNA helicase